MMGLAKNLTLSGFGAFQSNNNKTGAWFYIKSAVNVLDMTIMNMGLGGTPANGANISPVFLDDKVSEDLQNAGYDQYEK